MIQTDKKIIESDFIVRDGLRLLSLYPYRSILHEAHIRLAGYESYQAFELGWGRRDWHLGLWVLNGTLQATHTDGGLDVGAGEILIVPAQSLRSVSMISPVLSSIYVHFPDIPHWQRLKRTTAFKMRSHCTHQLTTLFSLLETDLIEHKELNLNTTAHLVRAFCGYVTEDIRPQKELGTPEIRARFADLWKRVHSYPAADWTVDLMAKQAYFSKGHFHRSCKEQYGLGPMAMVTRIRLEHGASALLHTDDTLEAIASRVGFSCARAFSEAFLRNYDVRPGRFRRGE